MTLSGLWEFPSLLALDWVRGPGAPLVALLALAIDALIGDPRFLPHPVRLMGWLTGLLDRRLNRPKRSAATRLIRGLLAVILVLGLAAAAGLAIDSAIVDVPYGWLIELALVAVLLAQRDLFDHVHRVARALDQGGLEAGRAAVGRIVGRNVQKLDAHGVARAAIESCVESFLDGVLAPLFWYLALGLPGLLAYKAINTMDSMIGHKTERHAAFGLVAARLDDAVNWLPARLAGFILVAAALFVPRASATRALRIMVRDHGKHDSPNAGWPEAAAAGALDLALLGPRVYGAVAHNDPWLGNGTARATVSDLRRALYLYVVACVLTAGLVAAFALLSQAAVYL
jgi:adenosylcobinamide-phosphate synthase